MSRRLYYDYIMIAWMECWLEATGIWIEVGLQVHVVS
jgi:hypothetical protein